MVTKNDVTGDSIKSRVSSNAYKDNYDAIFGKNKKEEPEHKTEKEENNDQNV